MWSKGNLFEIFNRTILLVLGLCSVDAVEYYTTKPSYLHSCRIYEPEFTKCSTNTVQKLIEQLVIGIPEVVAEFGPIEPMKVKDVMFKQQGSESASIRANLTDVVIHGFSNTICKESKVSKKDFSWQTKFFIPKMRLTSNYAMNGRVLLLPLQGSGKMFMEVENMDVIVWTKVRLYEKGGFTFENVTDVRVVLNMTKITSQYDNLFNGRSKEIEESTNQFFNDNWRELYEALKPIVIETIEGVLFNVMHKVFQLFPASFIVEDIPTSTKFYSDKTKARHQREDQS